jgi:hypothetical protein
MECSALPCCCCGPLEHAGAHGLALRASTCIRCVLACRQSKCTVRANCECCKGGMALTVAIAQPLEHWLHWEQAACSTIQHRAGLELALVDWNWCEDPQGMATVC